MNQLQTSAETDFRQLLEQRYQEQTLTPYQAGAVIPLHSSELVIIGRGVAQLITLQPSGDEVLLGLVGPSMPIGLPLTGLDYYQVVALTDVDILRLPMVEVESSPVLAAGLLRHMILRLHHVEEWLALVSQRFVADRLRQLLLLLAEDFSQSAPVGSTPNGVRLTIRLTHQQLANAIASTRVTVTRLLKEFRDAGWLTIDDGYIILDRGALQRQVKQSA